MMICTTSSAVKMPFASRRDSGLTAELLSTAAAPSRDHTSKCCPTNTKNEPSIMVSFSSRIPPVTRHWIAGQSSDVKGPQNVQFIYGITVLSTNL